MKHISEIIPEAKQTCTKCKTPKELTEKNFTRDKRKDGKGFFTICRDCQNEQQREKYNKRKNEISYF